MKIDTKHTASPWRWVVDGLGNGTLFGNDGVDNLPATIVALAPVNVERWTDERNAAIACNAALMRWAPALLASMRQAIERVDLANREGNPILSAWLVETRWIVEQIESGVYDAR